jgi:hypothetical protein
MFYFIFVKLFPSASVATRRAAMMAFVTAWSGVLVRIIVGHHYSGPHESTVPNNMTVGDVATRNNRNPNAFRDAE